MVEAAAAGLIRARAKTERGACGCWCSRKGIAQPEKIVKIPLPEGGGAGQKERGGGKKKGGGGKKKGGGEFFDLRLRRQD